MIKNIPTLTCHACGYDMHDRKSKDLCPECEAPFDTRPDAYTKPWKLALPLCTSTLAILIMPFVAIVSLLLMFPAFQTASIHKKINPEFRTPHWAQRRLNQNQFLMWIIVIEFFAMTTISLIWPNALNWW
ncbi:MAG: hypothetical protein JKY43_10010 [Phycisphaerales bacterium]|nr:hypothetical protein [Phycisphaerales bacterium]